MRRTCTMLLTISTFIVLLCWMAEFVDACGQPLLESLCPDADRADRERAQRNAFTPGLFATLDAIADGSTSLSEASRKLLIDAAQLHPTFLRHLDVFEQGPDLNRKMARYLFGYFVGDFAVRAEQVDTSRRTQLVEEYRHILDHGL